MLDAIITGIAIIVLVYGALSLLLIGVPWLISGAADKIAELLRVKDAIILFNMNKHDVKRMAAEIERLEAALSDLKRQSGLDSTLADHIVASLEANAQLWKQAAGKQRRALLRLNACMGLKKTLSPDQAMEQISKKVQELQEVSNAGRRVLEQNGGPICGCETVNGDPYVMVRRDTFEDLAKAIDRENHKAGNALCEDCQREETE